MFLKKLLKISDIHLDIGSRKLVSLGSVAKTKWMVFVAGNVLWR